MWDLPGPGPEPVSPALAGGFLTTAPPGKSLGHILIHRRAKLFFYKVDLAIPASFPFQINFRVSLLSSFLRKLLVLWLEIYWIYRFRNIDMFIIINDHIKSVKWGSSLVAQCLRIHLPMQGTQVQALVREDPTCRRATKSVRHNYWACTLEPMSHNYWAREAQLLSLHATTTEAHAPRACALQQEEPPQWEARVPQRRAAPAQHN